MTRYLPPNLLSLFAPRESIQYIAPIERRKMPPYTGVAQYLKNFEDPKTHPPPPPPQILTKEERRAKKRKEKLEKELEKIKEQMKSWDPHNNPKATDEAYKTLFVARISFKTTEHKLKRDFEQYGPIKTVKMVYDLDGKPRGYAFIEYEREKDMRTAYKEADGKKIEGRRVLVDVERGRTVKGWKPRRFGGDLGGTRRGGPRENIRTSGRAPPNDRGFEERRYERDERERGPERDRGYKRSREERDERRESRRDERREDRRRPDGGREGREGRGFAGGDRGDYERRDRAEREKGVERTVERNERGSDRGGDRSGDLNSEDRNQRRRYR